MTNDGKLLLWCAENFGWTPSEVYDMDWTDLQCIIKAWNGEQDKVKHEMNVRRMQKWR